MYTNTFGKPPVFGMAQNEYLVYVQSFSQSVGAEMLVNGTFAAWTGDNPNSWTVGGESGGQVVTERDSGQLNADTKTTGGSANFFVNTATDLYIVQVPGLTIGNVYVIEADVSAVASGDVLFNNGSSNCMNQSVSITGVSKTIDFAEYNIFYLYGASNPINLTIDTVSIKPVTLNTQQTSLANARDIIEYTLPATPRPHHAIELRYRIVSSQSFIRARMARNAANTQWSITLDKFTGYAKTNLITASNIGDTDAIRVDHTGNTHALYTRSGGTWTQRGTTITDATHNTATGLNVFYVPEFTPSLLSSVSL